MYARREQAVTTLVSLSRYHAPAAFTPPLPSIEKEPGIRAFSVTFRVRFSGGDAVGGLVAADFGNSLCRRFVVPIRQPSLRANSDRFYVGEPKPAPLVIPATGKNQALQLVRREVERLTTVKDRIDDVRGEEGQG